MVNSLTTMLPGAGNAFGTAAGFFSPPSQAQLSPVATAMVHQESLEAGRALATLLRGRHHLLDVRVAVEGAFNEERITLPRREMAVQNLRRLEREFDKTYIPPEALTLQEKLRRLELCGIPFSNVPQKKFPDTRFAKKIKLLFQLVQLHEFLHRFRLAPFLSAGGGNFMTDLLCEEIVGRPLKGSCVPLALLAAHFGKRIGLPLRFYYSESHISVWVGSAKGFLYEPSRERSVFRDPTYYVQHYLAPSLEKPRDIDFEFFNTPAYASADCLDGRFLRTLAKVYSYRVFLDEMEPEIVGHFINLAGLFGPFDNRQSPNRRQMSRELLESALKLFPKSLHANLFLSLLLKEVDPTQARKHFETVLETLKKRLQIGPDGRGDDEDYRQIFELIQHFQIDLTNISDDPLITMTLLMLKRLHGN